MDHPTGIPTSSGSIPNNPLSDLQLGDQQQQPIIMMDPIRGMMNTTTPPNQLAYDQAGQPIQQQQQPIMMNQPRMNTQQNMVYHASASMQHQPIYGHHLLASSQTGIGSSSSNKYEQQMEMLGRKYPPLPPISGSVILPDQHQHQPALNMMMQHATTFPTVDWDGLPGNWREDLKSTQQHDAATLLRSNKRKKIDSELDFNSVSAMSLKAAAESLQVDVADFKKEAYKKGIYQWLNDSSQYERITVPFEALDKDIMVIVTKCTADKEIDQIPYATRPIRMPGRRPFFKVKERLEQEFGLQANSSSSAYDTEFLMDGFWVALNNEEHWDFAVKAWNEGRENKAAIHVRIFPRPQLAI